MRFGGFSHSVAPKPVLASSVIAWHERFIIQDWILVLGLARVYLVQWVRG